MRIGIHTGPVVVGEIGAGERTERLALGETPNLAARVQGQAEPDTVVISQATYRLVQGFFTCEGLGPQSLKNVAAPLELYRVHGEGAAHSRFEVSVQKGLTPLVGREPELGLLRQRWEQAKEGAGQVVLLSGEPGIGKSRLVQELKEQLSAPKELPALSFAARPITRTVPCIRSLSTCSGSCSLRGTMRRNAKLEKLQHSAEPLSFPPGRYRCPCWPPCCRLPHPEGLSAADLQSAEAEREDPRSLSRVAGRGSGAEQPSMRWEDLHWADPSTSRSAHALPGPSAHDAGVGVADFRPEFTPPWGNRSHLSQLTLSRLGRQHVEAMVEQVTGGKALPAEVVQQIVSQD